MKAERVKQAKWWIYLLKGCRCRLQRRYRSLWQLPKIIVNREIYRASCSHPVKDANSTCSALSASKSKGLWKVNRDHLAGWAPGETALHAEHSKVIHKEMENQSDSGRRRLSLKTQTAGTAKLIGAVNSPSTAIKTQPAGTVLQQIWGVVVNVCVLCGWLTGDTNEKTVLRWAKHPAAKSSSWLVEFK